MKAAQKTLRAQFNQVVAKMEAIRYEPSLKAQLTYKRLQAEKESILFQLKHTR